MKKKLFSALLALMMIGSVTACNGGGNNPPNSSASNTESSTSTGESTTVDETLAENYDFGSPEAWAGEKVAVTDLGDCIVDVYPHDERYDWGQSIIWDEEDGLYKKWWCRHSRYDSIWYAESYDLKNWFNAQKVMYPESNTTWIKLHVGKPSVLKINGEYKMWFEAPATLNGWKEFDNNVFYATSQNGINWEIYSKNGEPYPVIRMSDEQMAESWEASQREDGSGYGYYGFGQPSVTYKDGLYYVYYTHTLFEGDRFYVTTSTDGINFESEGREVFTRAGSGVKYNELTGKFMMAYEYTTGRNSKVYYMESTDGYKFTYSNYTEASSNQNVLSTGAGFVRGYPDFVGNGEGHVTTHTVYVSYMEGTMADGGNDWRQYSHTWDIHIAAFNPAEFEKRTIVLPNGRIKTSETMKNYRTKHEEYEDRLVGIDKLASAPVADGEKDAVYENAVELSVDRTVCEQCAVPGDIYAKAYVGYTAEYFCVYLEVNDKTEDASDRIYMLLDEKRFATEAVELLNVEASRDGTVKVTDGDGNEIAGVKTGFKLTENGYAVEIVSPWRYKTTQTQHDSIGFDVYVFDNAASLEYKSVKAWSDFKIRYEKESAGELFFR